MLVKLYSDVFDISQRVKNIDSGYYILFNTSNKKFEVHNSNQVGSSYCLTLPFKELDERTLNFINKTKSNNIEKILKEIENENKLRESSEKSRAFSDAYYNILDIGRWHENYRYFKAKCWNPRLT